MAAAPNYVDTMVHISQDAPGTINFLRGSRAAFSIVFKRESDGCRIVFEVTVPNEKDTWTTSMKSTKLLGTERWYTVDAVFLDGVFSSAVKKGGKWIILSIEVPAMKINQETYFSDNFS